VFWVTISGRNVISVYCDDTNFADIAGLTKGPIRVLAQNVDLRLGQGPANRSRSAVAMQWINADQA
jgi:hypothetical protein